MLAAALVQAFTAALAAAAAMADRGALAIGPVLGAAQAELAAVVVVVAGVLAVVELRWSS